MQNQSQFVQGAVLAPTDFEHVRNELSEWALKTTDEDISAYRLKILLGLPRFTINLKRIW